MSNWSSRRRQFCGKLGSLLSRINESKSAAMVFNPGCTLHVSAAAAKSLQSCPTLCDPIDGSPPGSAVPGIHSLGKNSGVGCHFLLQCMKVKSETEVTQSST